MELSQDLAAPLEGETMQLDRPRAQTEVEMDVGQGGEQRSLEVRLAGEGFDPLGAAPEGLAGDGLADVLSDDPDSGGDADPTIFPVRGLGAVEVPTLSQGSLVLLTVLLSLAGTRALRR